MRLLERKSDGEFSLTKDLSHNIPRYAILSHTWAANSEEEVTFKDLMDGTANKKLGYNKIRFCGEQARRDGLQHFWVDTCCIDKASSAELTEAINCMFRWYQDATKCYVYLSDVSEPEYDENDVLRRSIWKLAFRKSKWFTRGWTLQELLAPTLVEFFSSEGMRLGDKKSREQQIHEITGIPIGALQGHRLSDFSPPERMSWATTRKTTREEDKAYSLLGIFDVSMPLIYGEGKKKAFARLREEMEKQDRRLMKIRQWLSAPDPSINYQKAFKQRQADTGLWFLESKQYIQWRTATASVLWLYGIPGRGKTILSSTIIQNIYQYRADDLGQVVAYFYFDFNDQQKQVPELMIRSLILQLLQQCFTIPMKLETLFSSCENGQRQPALDALLDVLKELIHQFSQAYIILDVLDECTDRAELLSIFEGIVGWQLNELHLLVTSRRERDIESSLVCLVEENNIICLQSKLVDQDIRRYVHQRLSTDKHLKKWHKNPDIVHEIETIIMKGAHGMFRWAVCQLDALTKCLSRAMLRKALADLPPTLDATYERILCSINPDYSEYASRILQWLTFSARPLLVEEVAEALAIDFTRDLAFDRDGVLEEPWDVLQICSSLVTIAATEESSLGSVDRLSHPKGRVLLLAHYSVKEYLVSNWSSKGLASRYSMKAPTCNEFIGKCCLGYLLHFRKFGDLSNRIVKEFKLARYSARFWITHAQSAALKAELFNDLILELFSTDNGAFQNWIRLYDPETPWYEPDIDKKLEKIPTPLYYTSLSGLTAIVELLLSKGADVNAQGGGYGNALQAASYSGHTAIVELLLSKGADVNVQGGGFGNALQAALSSGHTAIVELLLSKGATN